MWSTGPAAASPASGREPMDSHEIFTKALLVFLGLLMTMMMVVFVRDSTITWRLKLVMVLAYAGSIACVVLLWTRLKGLA